MTVTRQIHSGTKEQKPSERELAHGVFARRAAAEGMVLLKNEGLLPLDSSMSVALFGGGAVRTVKGGTGSGDVNNRENISIYRGMKEAEIAITSEDWVRDYEKCYETARKVWKEKVLEDVKHRDNPFDAYAWNPFALPEGRGLREEDLKGASAAVYVISRIAGEGKDRRREEGDYELSKREREDILWLDRTGLPIVLILNVGAPVELTRLLEETKNLRAILHISLPGQEGGRAVCDVLFGYMAPGGRLTDTWARRYEDYPSAESFGYLNGDLETEEYREGIFVGYRHFDRAGISPLFPFGYGLSYTEFSMRSEGFQRTEAGVELTVSVKNTGDRWSGREVVQVYATLPRTGLEKEAKRLIGFAKTGVLSPGECQRLTIFAEPKDLASFSEELHAWVLEAGEYGVWIGSHAASLQPAAQFTLLEQVLLEQTKTIGVQVPEAADFTTKDFAKWEKETEGMSVEELIPLLYGNITVETCTLGSAGTRVPGSAGETTERLEETRGIRSLIMADGPAGLRLRQNYEVDCETDEVYGSGILSSLENGYLEEAGHHENVDIYYQFCTAFPVGTALAQSWDRELMRQFGEKVAVEMEEFHVDLWLAPGLNIHRNPLCGRNFEYYSEDPFLSGQMAAAVTDGVQSRGNCGVTIKHFACNNQEDNRMDVDARLSERTLREIYLRGFEIVVKKSNPVAMMTSYNLVNGLHAANSRDLCTVIAREEWGFEGVIMTDWGTTGPEDGSIPWKCVDVGNDIMMPGSLKDDEDIRRAYERGALSEEAIRRCGGRVLWMVRRLTGSAEG